MNFISPLQLYETLLRSPKISSDVLRVILARGAYFFQEEDATVILTLKSR